jgi:hypothetical protein
MSEEAGIRLSYQKLPSYIEEKITTEIDGVITVFSVSPYEVQYATGKNQITRKGGMRDENNKWIVSFYTKDLYSPFNIKTVDFFARYFALICAKANSISSLILNNLKTMFLFSEYKNEKSKLELPTLIDSNIEQIIFVDIQDNGWCVAVAVLDRFSPQKQNSKIKVALKQYRYGAVGFNIGDWNLRSTNNTKAEFVVHPLGGKLYQLEEFIEGGIAQDYAIHLGVICNIMYQYSTKRIISRNEYNAMEDTKPWKNIYAVDFCTGALVGQPIFASLFKKATTTVSSEDLAWVVDLLRSSKLMFKNSMPISSFSISPNITSNIMQEIANKLSEHDDDSPVLKQGIQSLLDNFINLRLSPENDVEEWPSFE